MGWVSCWGLGGGMPGGNSSARDPEPGGKEYKSFACVMGAVVGVVVGRNCVRDGGCAGYVCVWWVCTTCGCVVGVYGTCGGHGRGMASQQQ